MSWLQVGILCASFSLEGCGVAGVVGVTPTDHSSAFPSGMIKIDTSGRRLDAAVNRMQAAATTYPDPVAELLAEGKIALLASPDGAPPQVGYSPFSDGRAMIFVIADGNLSYGFVNETGAWVVPLGLRFAKPFSEGFAAVMRPQESYVLAQNAKGGGAYPVTGDMWEYIDVNGNTVIPARFFTAESFFQGKAPARGVDCKTGLMRTGLIDKNGTFVKWSASWRKIGECREGRIAVCAESGWLWKRARWGYLDVTGRIRQCDAVFGGFGAGIASR